MGIFTLWLGLIVSSAECLRRPSDVNPTLAYRRASESCPMMPMPGRRHRRE
jgi:hypothetical protein